MYYFATQYFAKSTLVIVVAGWLVNGCRCKPEKEICLDDPAAATECIPKPFTIEDIIAPTCQDSQIKPKEEMEIKQLDLQSLALMRQLFGVAGKVERNKACVYFLLFYVYQKE